LGGLVRLEKKLIVKSTLERVMTVAPYNGQEAAEALLQIIGGTTWEAVTLAHGYLSTLRGGSDDDAARAMYERGPQTLKRSRELLAGAKVIGFLEVLTKRVKTGSAENPVTKLFPAAITEQRFLELLDTLVATKPSVSYSDDRQAGHTLTDFSLAESQLSLPINIKNAGTRFERAFDLVGLQPDDCIPIPAYKAYAALEAVPDLLYAVSQDYGLMGKLDSLLPGLFDRAESIVWDLLNRFGGTHVQKAEDSFVAAIVRKHWAGLKVGISDRPFHLVSARKSVRILQTKPKRTPGIGLKAWGTGASAEVNVHLSIREDTTPWEEVSRRIVTSGLGNVVAAVNRKRMEEVYDPEI
jgi:hypothetical protein